MGNTTGNKTWMVIKIYFAALSIFLLSAFIYFLTSAGNTAFNHYTLLADSFLNGKLYVQEEAPWLEQVPINNGAFYVANPPLPAVIAMPFVALFGRNFPQQIISHLFGAAGVLIVFFLSLKIKHSFKLAIWSALLGGFANIIWFLSASGSMWYLAQVIANFLLLLSVLEAIGKKRASMLSVLIGLAFLSRLQAIIYLPFLIFLISNKKTLLRNSITAVFSILPFILLFGVYNFLRFGDFFQTGLTLIPGLVNEPWFKNGLFSISNIAEHLKLLFNSYPVLRASFPFIIPPLSGLAIWITSPVFVFALKNNLNDKAVFLSWVAILFILLIDLAYGSSGTSQFGYRYAVDVYPLLFFLTIKGVSGMGPHKIHWLVLAASILVNLWGVTFIKTFN